MPAFNCWARIAKIACTSSLAAEAMRLKRRNTKEVPIPTCKNVNMMCRKRYLGYEVPANVQRQPKDALPGSRQRFSGNANPDGEVFIRNLGPDFDDGVDPASESGAMTSWRSHCQRRFIGREVIGRKSSTCRPNPDFLQHNQKQRPQVYSHSLPSLSRERT